MPKTVLLQPKTARKKCGCLHVPFPACVDGCENRVGTCIERLEGV